MVAAKPTVRIVLITLVAFGLCEPIGAQTVPPESTLPPRTVIAEAARDFLSLASVETLKVLGVGATTAAAVHPADRNVNWQLRGSDYRFLAAGRVLGNAAIQGGAAAATYLVGLATSPPRVGAIGQQLVRAQLVTQASTFAIKVTARRDRPDGNGHLSFPSGHASTTFATATILDGHFGWRVSIPAYLIATYVATSRLHENRHNVSDVACGAALGIAAGRVTLRRERSRVTVQPTATIGGAGLIVVW
jgi:membrane-associated phospholipid phosphatase